MNRSGHWCVLGSCLCQGSDFQRFVSYFLCRITTSNEFGEIHADVDRLQGADGLWALGSWVAGETVEQVVDFSVIQKLGEIEEYASQKNEYRVRFAPKATSQILAESEEVLTNTVIIHFAANDHNLHTFIAIRGELIDLCDHRRVCG